MAENVTKLPVKRETMEPAFTREWHPFESLHREIDRLFDDFGMGFRWPFRAVVFCCRTAIPAGTDMAKDAGRRRRGE